MQSTPHTPLPIDVTHAAGRAQTLLDCLLTDIEQMPNASIPFRARLLNQVINFIHRLTAVRKTMVALQTQSEPNQRGIQNLSDNLKSINAEINRLRATLPAPPVGGHSCPPSSPSAPDFPASPLASTNDATPLQGSTDIPVRTSPGTPSTPTRSTHAPVSRHIKFTNPQNLAHPNGRFSLTNLPTLKHLIPPFTPRKPTPAPPEMLRNPQPATRNPPFNSQPATRNPPLNPQSNPQPAPTLLDKLAHRLPPTLNLTPADLPPRSNDPRAYAPIFNFHLVPFVNTVRTLSLDQSDPAHDPLTRVEAELIAIADATLNTRAKLLYKTNPAARPHRAPPRSPKTFATHLADLYDTCTQPPPEQPSG